MIGGLLLLALSVTQTPALQQASNEPATAVASPPTTEQLMTLLKFMGFSEAGRAVMIEAAGDDRAMLTKVQQDFIAAKVAAKALADTTPFDPAAYDRAVRLQHAAADRTSSVVMERIFTCSTVFQPQISLSLRGPF